MSESHTVYQRLAQRIRQVARDEHRNHGSGIDLFRVVNVAPLRLEAHDSDLVLEDGDPDFVVGAWLRQYILQYTLEVGDQVHCARIGNEWRTIDVADPGGQAVI